MTLPMKQFPLKIFLTVLLLTLILVGCSTWIDSELRYNSAFHAWWSQLPPQAKQSYEQDENAGRLAFAEWYENQPPDQRAQYKQMDAEREKASLLYKGQMQQGVVQEQLMLP